MNTFATSASAFMVWFWVGIVVSGIVGCLVGAVASYFPWRASRAAWINIRNVYSITVITYWLKRLEREGWRTFDRARTKHDDTAEA